MLLKKGIAFILSSLFLVSFIFSQDLAELAKKEKERREKLKDKKGIVITNVELAKSTKQTAISIATSDLLENETGTVEGLPEDETSLSEDILSDQGATPEPEENREEYYRRRKTELENNWKKAKEYADLLMLKMNGLWQEYYSMDDMTSRDKVQMDISETYLQLQKSRQEEAQAKEELDNFIEQARKEGALPGWLR